MQTASRRGFRRATALAALVALALALVPGPTARARPTTQAQPLWSAWALSADFAGGQLKVLYKAYIATYDNPPIIVGAYDEEITDTCVTSTGGPISFAGDYAVFDGSYYITCTVPSWRDSVRSLNANYWPVYTPTIVATVGDGPVWAAADVVLDPLTSNNPVLDASDLGLAFSLPRNGGNARAVLSLSNGNLTSPNWAANDVAGNRMLIGTFGPGISAFHKTYGWLSFLNHANWQNYFSTNANGLVFASWVESPVRRDWRVAPFASYTLATGGGEVTIGYNQSTGSYFRGKIRSIRVDPGSQGL